MMNNRSIKIMTITSVFVLISTIASFTVVSGESNSLEPEMSKIPRYSDVCAHGHNGFDCKESSYRVDITDLQKRVSELEKYH